MFRKTARGIALSSVSGACLLLAATLAPAVYTPARAIYSTPLGQLFINRAGNAGALSSITAYAVPIMRDDVGALYSDTGASCANADRYAQVQPASGHCWKIAAGTRWTPRIWGANGGDDSAAWTAALAYLGSLPGPQELLDDLPTGTITAARLTVPSNVTVRGTGEYVGADSGNLATLYFTASTGGFYLSNYATLTNLNLVTGSTGADHLIETAGENGISKVRCSYYVSCIRVTKTISPSISGASVAAGGPAGLTSGTYTGVAFTGGGGSGATMSVTVSGGSITAVSFSAGGTGYLPWFDYGFAAGALYSGSPAIAVVGQVDTANTGRSKYQDIFLISNGSGSGNTGTGLESDAAYDFVDIDNVEVWSPSSIQGTGVGFRFGHIDGLSLHNPKCFGIYEGVSWTGSTSTVQAFGAVDTPQFDNVVVGMYVTFPLAQLTVSGGYTRALGKPLYLRSPGIQFTETGHAFYSLSDNVQLADFGQLSLTGNSFTTAALSGTAFGELYVGLGSGTQSGAGNAYIGGNTFDGRVPAMTLDASTKGVTVGPNRWPGRQYAATSGGNPTPGYMNNAGAANSILPITGGQIQLSVNAGGQATIPWTLGNGSQQPSVSIIGVAGYSASIANITTEGMVVQVYGPGGAAVTSGTFTFIWRA